MVTDNIFCEASSRFLVDRFSKGLAEVSSEVKEDTWFLMAWAGGGDCF
jgi:hypothetical protein